METFLQQRGGVTEESLGPRIEDEQPRLVEAEPRACPPRQQAKKVHEKRRDG